MEYIKILFLNISKTSLVASFLIIMIILLRFVFQKKIKTNYIYLMWIILLIRLVFPFGFESNVSIENIIFNDDVIENFENTIDNKKIDNNKEIYSYFYEESQSKREMSQIANNTIFILSIIWLLGILVILFIPIITYFTLIKELRRNRIIVEESISKASMRAENELGILKRFSITKSPLIDSPSLIGLKKPMIILPKDFNKDYEDNYKIFLHEYIHYEKKHLLYQWIFWIIKAVYWFNPLIWIAHYLMKQDAEYVCDEKVIEVLGDKKGYGSLILDVADNINNDNYMINTVGFSYKKKELKNRIIRIMNTKKNHILLRIVCIICTILLIPIFFTSYHEIEKQVEAIEINQELNVVGNNDIFNAKILKYEYSSETGDLIVDFEYEIDEDFLDGFSNEGITILFNTQLLFLGSKNPEIRNKVIRGSLYSEEDNFRRFSFNIGRYDFEQFGNAVFRIEPLMINVEIGEEEIYEINVKDIPVNIKVHDKIDMYIKKLSIEDSVYIEYVIKGYKGKSVTIISNIYGDSNGYKVESISSGGYFGSSSNEYSDTSNNQENVYTYFESDCQFNNFEDLSKDKIYIGISCYEIELMEKPIDFKIDLGDYIKNEQKK